VESDKYFSNCINVRLYREIGDGCVGLAIVCFIRPTAKLNIQNEIT